MRVTRYEDSPIKYYFDSWKGYEDDRVNRRYNRCTIISLHSSPARRRTKRHSSVRVVQWARNRQNFVVIIIFSLVRMSLHDVLTRWIPKNLIGRTDLRGKRFRRRNDRWQKMCSEIVFLAISVIFDLRHTNKMLRIKILRSVSSEVWVRACACVHVKFAISS